MVTSQSLIVLVDEHVLPRTRTKDIPSPQMQVDGGGEHCRQQS